MAEIASVERQPQDEPDPEESETSDLKDQENNNDLVEGHEIEAKNEFTSDNIDTSEKSKTEEDDFGDYNIPPVPLNFNNSSNLNNSTTNFSDASDVSSNDLSGPEDG